MSCGCGCHGLPVDHLSPVWMLEPFRPGPCAIALDPREACFVVANGCTLDGIRYRASFKGWDGEVGEDGRVVVRLDPVEGIQAQDFIDCSGSPRLEAVA